MVQCRVKCRQQHTCNATAICHVNVNRDNYSVCVMMYTHAQLSCIRSSCEVMEPKQVFDGNLSDMEGGWRVHTAQDTPAWNFASRVEFSTHMRPGGCRGMVLWLEQRR